MCDEFDYTNNESQLVAPSFRLIIGYFAQRGNTERVLLLQGSPIFYPTIPIIYLFMCFKTFS